MRVGRLAILAGVVVALIGFVLITNWESMAGFIWNIQHADIVLWYEQEGTQTLLSEPPPVHKRVLATIPYWAVLIISILAIAAGIYMENSDRWKNKRL